MQMPIDPASHQSPSASQRPVQVKVQGAKSTPRWIALNQPTLTQSMRLSFQRMWSVQVRPTLCLRSAHRPQRSQASKACEGGLSELRQSRRDGRQDVTP